MIKSAEIIRLTLEYHDAPAVAAFEHGVTYIQPSGKL